MRTTFFLALIALVFFIISPPAQSEERLYWPGWHGPFRNGWVAHFQPPVKWPDKLKRVWKVEVGTGYGSPVVWDKRIYQHARQGDEEVVWCLNAENGEVLWRKSYPVAFKIGGGAQRHGKGPKATPAFSLGRLYTVSITGVLSAWDGKTGDLLWRRDFKERMDKSYPYWGASTSPLIDGDFVIVHPGTCDAGALLAIHRVTGKDVWSHGEAGSCYSSPLLVEMLPDVRQVVEWNHDGIAGVASENGRPLWEFPFPHEGNNQNMPSPVSYQNRILVGGENRGIRSVEPRFERKTWTVVENWHQEEVALDMSTPVINDDLLFGFSHYKLGQLFCLEAKTGKILWKGPPRTGDNVAFLSVRGYVLAQTDRGELHVIEATGDRYNKVASYRVAEEGETWASPALLTDGILIKDKSHLAFWAIEKE